MTVKIIAVDMDGTFLNEDKKYNKARFLKQYQQLQQRGIHFVVASGNQLSTLKNYFPEIAHQLAFISENGAYVVDAEQEVSFAHFSANLVDHMRVAIAERYASALILCGKRGAYIDHAVPEQNLEKLNKYFKSLQQIPDLAQAQDQICKVTLDTRQYDFSTLCDDLQQFEFIANGSVKMVSSGFGFIDLIVPNRHKAHGLQLLQQRWSVSADQVLAIGDNYNDLEMVKQSGYGFAVANAVDELKQAANFVTEKNNQQEVVLDVIDQVLLGQVPFHSLHKKSA
ncbi:Cof-type HAD-IIB family hydrolase [Acinetobacter sp. ANC 3791]|uniref:Cof-type HAD-IIB family hydrolase n=1 Tax=Acinetobacter sp. ANC 3791 TaxID=2529836 RepID=UPI00103A0635|nr:Cof-type HAD-IIB family hydrolase [Acinetobacter sp. ANC 3791]TCB84517.1 HAD family hydrolase [Acinetobacter sp. ANC 3791]